MLAFIRAFAYSVIVNRFIPNINLLRAQIFSAKGEYQRAEYFFKSALNSRTLNSSDRQRALMDLSYAQFKLRKMEEAELSLRNLIFINPQKREAHLRLAKIQLWCGSPLDASWTLKRAIKRGHNDHELVSFFLLAVCENGGPEYLLEEAYKLAIEKKDFTADHQILNLAIARYQIIKNDGVGGVNQIAKIALASKAPFESVIAYAETLYATNEIIQARNQLKRALLVSPDHPRLLSLLAETYLNGETTLYNPSYAAQLAANSCQSSGWVSARELHIYARALLHCGDKTTALMVANKAFAAGSRLLGSYSKVKEIERLISQLSSSNHHTLSF
ncbi:MAG TPA: hypothetical protein PKD37_06670 [Oligoflexia bacterium]|nr:hypothetical protein [Oligoflexia bacterium]HMP27645.1 hypothetical protein [Oligoflexia bacterium]